MANCFRKVTGLLAAFAMLILQGCAVVSVVDAGISIAATAVGTVVSVAGTAVSVTAKAGGAVIDAVIPDSKKDKDSNK